MKKLIFVLLPLSIFLNCFAKGGSFNKYIKENLKQIPSSCIPSKKGKLSSCETEVLSQKYILLQSYKNLFDSLIATNPSLEKKIMGEIKAWDNYINAYMREIFIYDRPFEGSAVVKEKENFLIRFLKERIKVINSLKNKGLGYSSPDVDLTPRNGAGVVINKENIALRDFYQSNVKDFSARRPLPEKNPFYPCVKASDTPYGDDFLKYVHCSVYKSFADLITKFDPDPKITITFTEGQVMWEKYLNAHYTLLTQLWGGASVPEIVKARIFFLMEEREKFLQDWTGYYAMAFPRAINKLPEDTKKKMCTSRIPRYLSNPLACITKSI